MQPIHQGKVNAVDTVPADITKYSENSIFFYIKIFSLKYSRANCFGLEIQALTFVVFFELRSVEIYFWLYIPAVNVPFIQIIIIEGWNSDRLAKLYILVECCIGLGLEIHSDLFRCDFVDMLIHNKNCIHNKLEEFNIGSKKITVAPKRNGGTIMKERAMPNSSQLCRIFLAVMGFQKIQWLMDENIKVCWIWATTSSGVTVVTLPHKNTQLTVIHLLYDVLAIIHQEDTSKRWIT
ncbi:hypothetical protein ACJX0J_029469 [Zea mays]